MTGESFIDLDFCQKSKHGQVVSGDVFLSRKIKNEGRVVSVLSDGLGSGVKASVLANLTATMALRYTASYEDVRKSAGTIMDTLPICEVRKISYSTFTIVDLDDTGCARIIEHGNPGAMLFRGSQPTPIERAAVALDNWQDRTLHYCEVQLQMGDRIVCCSDGVTQSGLGLPSPKPQARQHSQLSTLNSQLSSGMPLGWGLENVQRYLSQQIGREPSVSSRELARRTVQEAFANDGLKAKDDITCSVLYFRHPRRLLVLTGPPFARERDKELASIIKEHTGRKAICGGTTAGIVSRLLNRPIQTPITRIDPEIPPASLMEGVDIVTEGTMTLARVAEMLERRDVNWPDNPARDLMGLMLESDIVEFTVGTRINEAHQDPNVPVELDLRRNIVRKIASLLETRYLKESRIRFI